MNFKIFFLKKKKKTVFKTQPLPMNRLFDGLINEPDLINIQSFINFIICEYENLKYFPITYDFIVNLYLIVYEF